MNDHDDEELISREDEIRVYTEPAFFLTLSIALLGISILITLGIFWLIIKMLEILF